MARGRQRHQGRRPRATKEEPQAKNVVIAWFTEVEQQQIVDQLLSQLKGFDEHQGDIGSQGSLSGQPLHQSRDEAKQPPTQWFDIGTDADDDDSNIFDTTMDRDEELMEPPPPAQFPDAVLDAGTTSSSCLGASKEAISSVSSSGGAPPELGDIEAYIEHIAGLPPEDADLRAAALREVTQLMERESAAFWAEMNHSCAQSA